MMASWPAWAKEWIFVSKYWLDNFFYLKKKTKKVNASGAGIKYRGWHFIFCLVGNAWMEGRIVDVHL